MTGNDELKTTVGACGLSSLAVNLSHMPFRPENPVFRAANTCMGRIFCNWQVYPAFHAFLQPLGGEALFAPLRLRIRPGKFREPDLLLVRDARDARSGDRFRTGADVVVEVVSPDRPERDLVHKRDDYAEAGIPEYRIVDPEMETVTVLKLEDGGYVESGVYDRHARARSPVLPDFGLAVGDVFDTAGGEQSLADEIFDKKTRDLRTCRTKGRKNGSSSGKTGKAPTSAPAGRRVAAFSRGRRTQSLASAGSPSR